MNSWMGAFHPQGEERRGFAHHPPVITAPGPLPRRSRGPWPLARSEWAAATRRLRCVGIESAGHRGPNEWPPRPQPSPGGPFLQAVQHALKAREERSGCSPPSCRKRACTGLAQAVFQPESRWWRCPPVQPVRWEDSRCPRHGEDSARVAGIRLRACPRQARPHRHQQTRKVGGATGG